MWLRTKKLDRKSLVRTFSPKTMGRRFGLMRGGGSCVSLAASRFLAVHSLPVSREQDLSCRNLPLGCGHAERFLCLTRHCSSPILFGQPRTCLVVYDQTTSSKRHFSIREHCTDPSQPHFDGMLMYATNRLGRNVAKASGVSPSRNEQSSGCSH